MNFNVEKFSNLSFEPVDMKKFKCVKLAYDAIKLGGSYPIVLNVANDQAVFKFLTLNISVTLPVFTL